MARRNASSLQIIRKDGKNCFVEALNSAFDIGMLQLKFVTYDQSRAKGDRFTNAIDIYMDFEDYFRISKDFTSGVTVKAMLAEKQRAAATGQYPKQIILCQGGTSAENLRKKGAERPDGKALSRMLKVFAGDKIPIIFKAEQGPGESDSKGLIVPKYVNGRPESYVQISMTYDDMKEFFYTIDEAISGYIATKAFSLKYETRLKELELENTLMKNIILSIAQVMNIDVSKYVMEYERDKAALHPNYSNYQNNQQPQNNYQNQAPANNQNNYNNQRNFNNSNYNNQYQGNSNQRFPDNFMNLPEPYDNEGDFFS